jgi:hypothetical protein
MTKSAFSGPVVEYGSRQNPAEGGSNNVDQGPGVHMGKGWIDQRAGYNQTRKGWIGVGVEYRRVLAQVPATLGVANIAALAHVVNGTPMMLAGASTGITVVPAGGLVVWPSGNTIPAGALVLDGNPTLQSYGQPDPNGLYRNNSYALGSMLSRCVQITGVAAGVGGNFLVSGWDIYGYPMTQLITVAAGVNSVASLKAFKFIGSVVPQFTDAHNYDVGTTDTFGLPVAVSQFHEALIWWNNALITANTGFTVADATSPATNLTGDVRGTYAVQSASDGTKRLALVASPAQVGLGTITGLFGQPQV